MSFEFDSEFIKAFFAERYPNLDETELVRYTDGAYIQYRRMLHQVHSDLLELAVQISASNMFYLPHQREKINKLCDTLLEKYGGKS